MTDILMSSNMYAGPTTPFGGPSLEWFFSNTIITKEDSDEKARIGFRGLPIVISGTFVHLRRILTQEYPRTEANIHRKISIVGVPIIERLVEGAPQHQAKMEKAFQSISSVADTREYEMNLQSV